MTESPASSRSIAILGTGRIGKMHADIVTQRIPGLHVASVYDVFTEGAQAVADSIGCARAESVEEIMASDVDAVAICSSTDTHVDLTVAAAEAGKAIFLEKPVSLNLAEVDRAVAAINAAGVPIQIGFNRRFDPSHAAVQAAVANGDIGELHMVKITSRDPEPPPIEYVKVSGGMFCDMTIHDFDMARFVTGSEIVEVFAKAANRVDPAIGEAGDVDTAMLILTHADGTLTYIDNSRKAVYGYDQRVEAFGSGGMVASENPRAHSAQLHSAAGTRLEPVPYFFLERYEASYFNEWLAFVEGLASGSMPLGIDDGRAPLVAGLAALKSVEEGRPVKISEIS